MGIKQAYLTIALFISMFSEVCSQPNSSEMSAENSGFKKENIRFGGNFGLSFGKFTYFEITPTISYLFSDKFASGIGLTYIYYKYNDSFYPYETSIYGGSIFQRFYLTDNIFQHGELEILNYEIPSINTSNNQLELNRKFVPALNIGAGYQSSEFMRGTYILFLYNILYGVDSRTPNPYVFRIGVNF